MPWLRRTGQMWKLPIFWSGMFGPWVLGQIGVGIFPDSWFLLSLAVFGWFLAVVRCPRCGGRPVWRLATKVEAAEFVPALLEAERCPICHDGAEPPPSPPPLFSAFRAPGM